MIQKQPSDPRKKSHTHSTVSHTHPNSSLEIMENPKAPLPPPPAAAASQKSDSGPPTNKEDPDTIRKPKRQRNCQLPPLDSVVQLRGSSNNSSSSSGGGSFSFTFDTKIPDDWTPETTPRFGSFNSCIKVAGKVRSEEDEIEGRKQGGEVMMISDGEDDDDDKKRSLG